MGAESPNVETECLPFSSIPHTSRLFEDYLHHFDRVKRFYAREGRQRGKNSLRGGHGPEIDLNLLRRPSTETRTCCGAISAISFPKAAFKVSLRESQAIRKLNYGLGLLYPRQSVQLFILNTTCANSYDFSGTQPADIGFAPWRSPYLRWRMETYSGLKMDKIGFVEFWGFMLRERKQLRRFLKWTAEMDNYARPKPKNP